MHYNLIYHKINFKFNQKKLMIKNSMILNDKIDLIYFFIYYQNNFNKNIYLRIVFFREKINFKNNSFNWPHLINLKDFFFILMSILNY